MTPEQLIFSAPLEDFTAQKGQRPPCPLLDVASKDTKVSWWLCGMAELCLTPGLQDPSTHHQLSQPLAEPR